MLRDGGIRPLIEINPGADECRDGSRGRVPVALRHPRLSGAPHSGAFDAGQRCPGAGSLT
jgi:hypothetical protein